MAKKEKITKAIEYHKNPRHITEDRRKELEKNMQELGDISGIVHDLNTGEIISGNQRSKIIKLNECEVNIVTEYKEPTEQGTVKLGFVIWKGQQFNYRAVRWDEAQREKANITANALTGFWSHEILGNEWGDFNLKGWGMPEAELKAMQINESKKEEAHRKLAERFIVPPFSVLNSRQGYWMQRKKAWKTLIEDKGESREKLLDGQGLVLTINNATSLFDPVLLELVAHWFCVAKSKIIDPFNGGFEKHYVFSKKEHLYTGIELRKEQYDLNAKRIKKEKIKSVCINDDGVNVLNHVKKLSQDLVFSCPPYFDLEKYSDLKNDASNQANYSEFVKIIKSAFSASYKALKNDRFAVIVVGDIRDKKTHGYRLLVDDVKKMWTEFGAILYNEIVFIEPLGTLPQRVGNYMKKRKVGKCHQNVLVFYKGDVDKISDNYKNIDYNDIDFI